VPVRSLDNVLISNKLLGSGSFGTVFAGKLDGKYVAVKLYNFIKEKHPNNSYEEWCIFMKEYSMLCRLQDTDIVGKFYGAGWNRGSWVMVIQRHSMRALKWKNHFLRTPENTKQIILDIFNAIDMIHQLTGYIHGDVKPDNIMIDIIDERPVVKIIDFGLSQPTGIVTNDYQFIHTVLWRSPELLHEEPCDLVLTDVWAAALTAFDIMAGHYIMYKLGANADINEIDMLHLILVKCIGRTVIPYEWEEVIDKELVDFANDIYAKYIVLASERKGFSTIKDLK
jgi:serine/threonine protein kinase